MIHMRPYEFFIKKSRNKGSNDTTGGVNNNFRLGSEKILRRSLLDEVCYGLMFTVMALSCWELP